MSFAPLTADASSSQESTVAPCSATEALERAFMSIFVASSRAELVTIEAAAIRAMARMLDEASIPRSMAATAMRTPAHEEGEKLNDLLGRFHMIARQKWDEFDTERPMSLDGNIANFMGSVTNALPVVNSATTLKYLSDTYDKESQDILKAYDALILDACTVDVYDAQLGLAENGEEAGVGMNCPRMKYFQGQSDGDLENLRSMHAKCKEAFQETRARVSRKDGQAGGPSSQD